MNKPVILTGIRANNDLHIGNYFGAMRPLIEMAKTRSNEFDINLFIPDLHSFTTPINHDELFDSIMNNARVYKAAGLPLDNDSIHLYRQSYVPAHSELTVLLNNFTGFGEMERMTQFKDMSKKVDMTRLLEDFKEKLNTAKLSPSLETIAAFNPIYNKLSENLSSSDKVSVGLFDYPVLMASDILLYNTKYVPVGDDQTQHLEITRDIATRMNNRFGELFTVPEEVKKQHEFFGKDQGLRIKDLVDPSKKMSKSDETGKGVIFLSDDLEVARKKIMSATTDDKASVAYDKASQPGISNLLEMLTLARQANGRDMTLQQTIDEFTGVERYSDFKKVVADEVSAFLTDFQSKLAAVDDAAILAKLESSERAMSDVANATLLRVQKAVGLRQS